MFSKFIVVALALTTVHSICPVDEAKAKLAQGKRCCPDDLNYCGYNLKAKMIKENCDPSFQPKEGFYYKCRYGQPFEFKPNRECQQCLITGVGLHDVCLMKIDPVKNKVMDVSGWMRLANNTGKSCCPEDVKYCGASLLLKTDVNYCSTPITADGYYECKDGQPKQLVANCNRCFITGSGLHDYCVNEADLNKKELNIGSTLESDNAKDELVPGMSSLEALNTTGSDDTDNSTLSAKSDATVAGGAQVVPVGADAAGAAPQAVGASGASGAGAAVPPGQSAAGATVNADASTRTKRQAAQGTEKCEDPL